MKIETKSITDLNPSDYNPRKLLKPGTPKYERLKKSIVEFGYLDPIVWNERTGRVVGGHQRLNILMDLGHGSVDVSVVDLDEDREKALNLALNKTGGSWDLKKLESLFEDIQSADLDVEVTGFSVSEIGQLGRYMAGESEDAGAPGLGEMKYQVVIECDDEMHQAEIIGRLGAEGVKCRALIL